MKPLEERLAHYVDAPAAQQPKASAQGCAGLLGRAVAVLIMAGVLQGLCNAVMPLLNGPHVKYWQALLVFVILICLRKTRT